VKRKTRPPPTRLLELLAERRASLTPLFLELRELVLRAAPESQELVYSNYAVIDVFTFTGRQSDAFCHIVAYEKHINLGFNQGATLTDSRKLLAGTGKRIRHVRIGSARDLKLPLSGYIRAAVDQAL
jgi:hypothetical protein